MGLLNQLSFTNNPTSNVDVSAQGFDDWVLFNALPPTLNKDGGGTEFSNYSGLLSPAYYNGPYPRNLTYTDANSGSGTFTGGMYDGFDSGTSGFVFRCKVGTAKRTFTFYGSRYDVDTNCRVQLSMSDSSASTISQTLPDAFTASERDFTLVFEAQADSENQWVELDFRSGGEFGSVDIRGIGVVIDGDPPPPVDFPTVVARGSDRTSTTNTTSHPITFPSHAIGDLLFVHLAVDGNPTVNIGSGSGWTKLGQDSNSNVVTGAIYWKIATSASESLTLSTTASEQSSHTVLVVRPTTDYAIAGISGSNANGSSTNSNPPNHAPGVGEQNFLWIATRAGDSTVVATAAPTNYTNLQTLAAAGTGGASTNTAERQLTATSEDPDTFTSANEQWVSWTVAVWQEEVDDSTEIDCALGVANAVGYKATIDAQRDISAALGVASAVGFKASIDQQTDINCSLGVAQGVGYQSDISLEVATSLGVAQAIGYQAEIDQQTSIECETGIAEGVGYPVSIANVTDIDCAPGIAAAVGYPAEIEQTIECNVGIANAIGLRASIDQQQDFATSLGIAQGVGYQAEIDATVELETNTGIAHAIGFPVSLNIEQNIECQPGIADAIGYQVDIDAQSTIECSTGIASAVGFGADVSFNLDIDCQLGVADAIGYPVQFLQDIDINCNLGIAHAVGYPCGVEFVDPDGTVQSNYIQLRRSFRR